MPPPDVRVPDPPDVRTPEPPDVPPPPLLMDIPVVAEYVSVSCVYPPN